MRVLYFHQHFTTPDGTGGTRSYEFARALVRRGHKVTMICGHNDRASLDLPWDGRHNWSRGTIDGIDVIAMPLTYSNRVGLLGRSILFLKYAWRSTVFALKEDYDLLFATSTPLTAGVPGIIIRLCGREKPFVFEVRDLWPELPRALGMKNPVALAGMSLLEWLSYRYADACVALAPGIEEGIKRRSPSGRKIAMIPNGCDLELFDPAIRKKLDLIGIRPDSFVAGFTGAHGIANGLDAVLDAAGVLRRRGRSDIQIVFVGDGNQKDQLITRAHSEGLKNVLFFPSIKKTEVARITASFDCGLMILANVPAFYYGTSPNKFFDYISAGIPVICNYPGWLAELITAHRCGIAVRPGDPAVLADVLIRLADEPLDRIQMGENARQLAKTEFGREKLAARFVEFLEVSVARSKF